MTFAENLAALRGKAGLTQHQLATAAGLTQGAISLLESGARTDPPLSTLQALARGLGVEPGRLIPLLPSEVHPQIAAKLSRKN